MSDHPVVHRHAAWQAVNPGSRVPPNPGEMPLPHGPPLLPGDEPEDDPDIGPTGPRLPGPDPDVDEPPNPSRLPDRLPGAPTAPGVRR
jgi:hypothetical protein